MFSNYLVTPSMDERMALPYDFNRVSNWDNLIHSIKLFLQRSIASILPLTI